MMKKYKEMRIGIGIEAFQFDPKIQHTPYHNPSPGGVFRLL